MMIQAVLAVASVIFPAAASHLHARANASCTGFSLSLQPLCSFDGDKDCYICAGYEDESYMFAYYSYRVSPAVMCTEDSPYYDASSEACGFRKGSCSAPPVQAGMEFVETGAINVTLNDSVQYAEAFHQISVAQSSGIPYVRDFPLVGIANSDQGFMPECSQICIEPGQAFFLTYTPQLNCVEGTLSCGDDIPVRACSPMTYASYRGINGTGSLVSNNLSVQLKVTHVSNDTAESLASIPIVPTPAQPISLSPIGTTAVTEYLTCDFITQGVEVTTYSVSTLQSVTPITPSQTMTPVCPTS